jgi:DNA primase
LSEERKIKLLKSVLGNFYNKGNEHLFYCPKCDHHKRKLSVNLVKSVFKCWVCDWSGRNIYRIIRQFGTIDQKYEWKSLDQQIEVEKFADKLFGESPEDKQDKISLPNHFISLANKELPNTSMYPVNYLKSRRIGKKDIIKWKIGYCPKGEYAGRVVIPSFDNDGDVNFFVTRSYDRNWRKYLNPQASKDIVFNHPYLDFDEDIVVVEGVFDAIKAGDNAVPLLGSTLTENSKLFMEIVKNDTPVYLALDPDADKKTNKLIRLFLNYDIELHLVEVSPFGDVGEMTKKEFLERKKQARAVSSSEYLLKRISNM